MKKSSLTFVVLTAAVTLLFTGCNGSNSTGNTNKNGGQEVKNDKVFLQNNYKKKDDGVYFGDKKIEGADPESFEAINEFYGKDKNAVFYQTKKIAADPATAEALGTAKLKDKEMLYDNLGKAFSSVDMATFKLLGDGEDHAVDKDSVFSIGIGIKKVKGADPKTFQSLEHGYGKDAQKVFWYDNEVKGADAASFEVTGFGEAKDKNSVYENSRKKE